MSEGPAKQACEEAEAPNAQVPGAHGKPRARRRRGRGVIYMSLRDADEALRKIDQHAKEMSKAGFARALGHDAPRGRFIQKLEALQAFKLVEVTNDNVQLTSLATDMLYGASEPSRSIARAKAFLSYQDFKRVFVECPKNQDHATKYVIDFVRGKLGVINEVDRFVKLFLDSAHFAGLLEGQPDPTAEYVRLRPAVAPGGNGTASPEPVAKQEPEESDFVQVPLDAAATVLSRLGLDAFVERALLYQQSTGAVSVSMSGGKITIELEQPLRVEVRSNDVLIDLPEIVRALRLKGLDV
jgi:hypothetical protein